MSSRQHPGLKVVHITAEDVDPTLSTYGLPLQQDPVDAIDIIGWSKQIILGQIGTSNNATNITLTNKTWTNGTTPNIRRHSQHSQHANQLISPYRLGLQKRVDGPIQCGPGQPCLDESCCSKEGKCGYKAAQCAPENCISNCDAKAMCGIDSVGGKTKCGLKLCCSYYGWCGTEDVHCKDPEPLIGKTPCQQGFGSCEIKQSPSCGKGSGTSKGRRIGYASPDQYTWATWIAIGGWSFNDPGTPTYNAYTDMVSTEANRRAFIQSLIKFMDTYGFQGADIDWEYPAEPKRGGRKEDTDNLVLLMKEMKEQFGGRYGSSLTLAPDYWYLRGFKPAEMQKYVDWMGFMSYDLHGPWDTDVKTLGSRVRPQTDITEIEKNLKPLWFDGVDPAKIVMGLAYYGRTYTLADPSCGKMGCSFIPDKGGAAGSCTNFPGVLSNREIKRIVKDEGVTPYFNQTAMVKYFTYQGNSWVGYDDAETYAMKEAFANSYCLGGIMIWSIDFDDETGVGLGDANGYKSPESATIIPMVHTTAPRGGTFTLDSGAATDVPRLPNSGNQNSLQGPGAEKCEQCSFFLLITSTCCGTGGSVGNPVLIPANVPTPMDIPLPAGFTPPQSFKDSSGNTVPTNEPLPKETPFVIGPGSPLREGEGDDQSSNSSNLKDPNPQVQCFFPCTFVLPPYTSFTTTVDYPRITVTESGTVKTTLTFPPLTVNDDRRTSIVQISSSTTWPYVTYTTSGTRRTTRPGPNSNTPGGGGSGGGGGDDGGGCKLLICPPPPRISFPHLTISHGPPKPTVTPCAWPTLNCPKPGPPPGPGPTSGGGMSIIPPGDNQEDDQEEEDEEEEEEEACAIRKRATKTIGVTVTATSRTTVIVTPTTTTTTTTKQPPPPAKTPDFSRDRKHCYDGVGQWTRRARMIDSADKYCDQSLKGKKLTEKWNAGEVKRQYVREVSEIIAFVEVVPGSGCEWDVDVNTWEQGRTEDAEDG
ncbi:carbohydrate-binding module family 18 protein [Bipolaris sorokiniana ND90Pr]|uniref:chitinase n=1 Tax=Cochliobolus sativus (strain ND90Pr / ATCC 201652) TaxID=665912 RepID=M2S316_COCSN|nr:carbohydrate-binding module family 18 protein [Bipolaris sorokiniana ND90Pr]EMD61573.1 carbohydrate-binding module family 18 protein [Bipolaris sorokiniana ND90Pr]